MTANPIRVAIVEDNADICEELERVVSTAPGFACAGTCRNAQTALRKIPALKPDVVIMDIRLPDGSGIDCTRQLKRVMPELQIMMFTVYEDSEQIFRALAAGANGYLLKRVTPASLLNALREVMNGGVPMTGEIARKVIASFRQEPPAPTPATEKLTPREQAVLEKLANGLSAKEIAASLEISTDTVNVHLKHIYQKLHVRSRTEAVIAYLK
jgi:DNA-binding NarL/FixJ family response regulator